MDYEARMNRPEIMAKKPEKGRTALHIAEVFWAIVTTASLIALLLCLAS